MKKVSTVSKIIVCSFLFSSAVFYYGCKKDRIEEQTLNTYDSPDSYLDSKKPEEQEFTIDSTGSGPIVGKNGTKIWQSKNCLMYPNGDSVTFPYTIKLVELYKPQDMIYYRMPTVAGGNILRTDGEIRLRAFKNTTELVLKPNPCFAQIEMPNQAPIKDMKVFYGFESNARPDWTDNPKTLGVVSKSDSIFATTSTGYTAAIGRLGWINCDKYANGSPASTLTFQSTVDDLTNVRFFIYLPSTKTVMMVYDLQSFNIPNNTDVKVIGIAMSGGTLYHFYQEMKVTASTAIDVEMKSISDPDLTTLLTNL
jgi:hypothetical protein